MAFKSRVKDYIDLFRLSLGVLGCIAVLVSGFIVYVLNGGVRNFIDFLYNNGILEIDGLTLGLIATFLLTCAIEAINDVYDVETDIANKRFDRPIARGAFTPEYVRNLTTTFFVIATMIITILVVHYQVTFVLLLFTLFCILIGIGYNYIKHTGFIGNMWVSIGYVAPLFIGFFLLKPQNNHILFNCILILFVAFFLATGREVIKDIQDYEGDRETNLNSLAVKIGPKGAGYVAILFFSIALFCATIVGFLVYNNIVFWALIGFLVIILGMASFSILTDPLPSSGGKKARKYTRWSLWTTVAAFFIGIFFM